MSLMNIVSHLCTIKVQKENVIFQNNYVSINEIESNSLFSF